MAYLIIIITLVILGAYLSAGRWVGDTYIIKEDPALFFLLLLTVNFLFNLALAIRIHIN